MRYFIDLDCSEQQGWVVSKWRCKRGERWVVMSNCLSSFSNSPNFVWATGDRYQISWSGLWVKKEVNLLIYYLHINGRQKTKSQIFQPPFNLLLDKLKKSGTISEFGTWASPPCPTSIPIIVKIIIINCQIWDIMFNTCRATTRSWLESWRSSCKMSLTTIRSSYPPFAPHSRSWTWSSSVGWVVY